MPSRRVRRTRLLDGDLTVTHTIRRTHDLTSSHIRETHITGGGGRRISGGHDETATRLLGSATRLGSSSASPRLGSASPLLSPRLCIAPVTSAEAGGELETAAGLRCKGADTGSWLAACWRVLLCHEYAQRSGLQKLSERCRGGEGRLERGGAVGASGEGAAVMARPARRNGGRTAL